MVTIFTPTFNRGYIIENLYKSLMRQTCKEFEWIVVDDGSTDDTEKLFRKWMTEKNEFPIQYKKVENGGKHRAVNIGVNMANADAFFIVDSDDYLLEDAVERVNFYFKSISNDISYGGVSGLKGYSPKEPIGGWGNFEGDYIDATNLERADYGLLKDKAEVYKTAILKKYPFPEFENENFITEGVVFNRIAKDGYKLRWFNEIIYICDYLEDGLTRCGYRRSVENPKGYMAYLNLMSGIYGKAYSDMQKFGFYFVLRSNNDKNSCRDKMQITLQEANCFEQNYEAMITEMNNYFNEHNIKDVAIYGMGNVGNAFCAVADRVDINILYAIDRRKISGKAIPVYLLDENLPPVDAVVITLKNYENDIEDILGEKFDIIVYWKDISSRFWIKQIER